MGYEKGETMKTNWEFINEHRITEQNHRGYKSGMWSTPDFGLNGLFEFTCNGTRIKVIASDGAGWKHVSVSRVDDRRPPTWQIMSSVKELFLGDEEWAVQYHPPRSKHINNHEGCLHIWIPIGETFPIPPSWMVGIQEKVKP